MKPSESEIEQILHKAPQPPPPANLKGELLRQVEVNHPERDAQTAGAALETRGWWQRWWPVLIPAAASCLCAVALTVQQLEIRDLRESLERLNPHRSEIDNPAENSDGPDVHGSALPIDSKNEKSEEEQLTEQVALLSAEIARLEQLQQENERIRAEINTVPTLSPEEVAAVNEAKQRALSIHCINNMKQFGLAVRMWAIDHEEVWPSDIVTISNYLHTPKILVCPGDTNRVVAKNWEVFAVANCSYDYLTPGAAVADAEPQRVLSRCPIHGHIGLCDGSVHSEVGKNHPEWFKERDGKLFLER